MQLRDSIDRFLTAIAGELSANTVRGYTSRLASLRRQHGEQACAELTREHIQGWLKAVTGGKAPDTVRLTLICWERWQKWAIDEQHLPAELVPKQRKPGGRQREALPTKEQTKKLFEKLPEESRPIFRALRLTGARPGELCGAMIADWDRSKGKITLAKHKTAKKTGRPRVIAIGHKSLTEILTAAAGDRSDGPLFLRANGKAWTTSALSYRYRQARDAAGLPADFCLYLTRHEHATDLYRATKDLKAVADALGHTQLGTTMRYARAQLDVLQDQQSKFDEGLC